MRRDLAGRRILITGASSGIGRALALQLALPAAKLIIVARREDKLTELAHELSSKGADVLAVTTDITVEADRDRLFSRVKERFGGLDVLINNAGLGTWAPFVDSSADILRTIMEVNFFAPVELIRLAIPMLREGKQPAIVNVSSMCGRRAMPGWSEYSASKYALCGLTEALRSELARFDVDILLIVPGLTQTDFSQHCLQRKGRAKIDFHKGMSPEQVAAGILKSLRKNKTETVLGREAHWVLWLNRFFPRLTDWLLARKIKKLYPAHESPVA